MIIFLKRISVVVLDFISPFFLSYPIEVLLSFIEGKIGWLSDGGWILLGAFVAPFF